MGTNIINFLKPKLIRCNATKNSNILGIDLGTTNCAVAILEGEMPIILENSQSCRTTPSVVAFTPNGSRLVGQIAKRQAVVNPKRTLFSVKRFIGRKFEDITEEDKKVPYQVEEDEKGKIKFSMPDIELKPSPEEVCSMILKKLVQDSENALGVTLNKSVITVPAYFNDSQRSCTSDSGKICGLDVKRIINEPTSAALAYGFQKREKNEKIMVFDLGGGTFDVSILEVGEGVFEVLSTSGDTQLGGNNFDSVLVNWLCDSHRLYLTEKIRKDSQSLQRLTEAAEKSKNDLSYLSVSKLTIPFISSIPEGPKHLDVNIYLLMFNDLTIELLNDCLEPIKQALSDANIGKHELSCVVLVGGATRINAVKFMVSKNFSVQIKLNINPDEAVAMGAVIQAGVLSGDINGIVLLDVTPMTLGVETVGDLMTSVIPRNTTIPYNTRQVFTTAFDNQRSVEIRILQGERALFFDNIILGTFNLDEITISVMFKP